MKRNVKNIFIFTSCIILVYVCLLRQEQVNAAESLILKSAGCKTEYFLLLDMAEAYTEKTGIKLQLGSTGNNKAITLLLDNSIDFAFTCESIDILQQKLKLDAAAVGKWQSIPVAKDPIVIVSNAENGVDSVTTEQLTELFQGRLGNWRQLGGNDVPVKLSYLQPQLESGVNLLFKEFTVGMNGNLDPKALLANGPAQSGNYVAMTPGGVTFMGFNSYQEKYGRILGINGMAPTRENILNGSYPLTATYYLTVTGNENSEVAKFIDFARSEEGRQAIERNFIYYTD